MEFSNELVLSASRNSWKMSSTHGTEFDRDYKDQKGNPGKLKDLWDKVWERDSFKCYYCNFQSKRHQEIHHLNEDHLNNSIDNLVTICPLCHQNFHLDTVSTTNGGKIIWLPELSQQELNYISRAIFIASDEIDTKSSDLPYLKIMPTIESSLAERALIVEQHFQNGASEPVNFANALINLNSNLYEKRYSFLKSFKLLNLRARFPIQTRYWKNNTFKDIPVETWSKLILDIK